MQDVCKLVHQVLNADTALLSLLGGKIPANEWFRIYNTPKAPKADEWPRITMFQAINSDDVEGDNRPTMSDVNVRIDVWAKTHKDFFAITKRVKEVLKLTANFECTIRIETNIFEEDTSVFHQPINVYILIDQ